jgi:PIN domain nuclease of toxin-antitoxin system
VTRILLDTPTFLWFVDDDQRLSRSARDLIEDPETEVLYSVVSVWESAIKVQLGRSSLLPNPVDFFEEEAARNSFSLLPIELSHLAPIATLPLHHRDPFDRLLISQALVEGIPLVSKDAAFDAYEGLTRLW